MNSVDPRGPMDLMYDVQHVQVISRDREVASRDTEAAVTGLHAVRHFENKLIARTKGDLSRPRSLPVFRLRTSTALKQHIACFHTMPHCQNVIAWDRQAVFAAMPSYPYKCPRCGAGSRRKPPAECNGCALVAGKTSSMGVSTVDAGCCLFPD